jgi:hypothetical protein
VGSNPTTPTTSLCSRTTKSKKVKNGLGGTRLWIGWVLASVLAAGGLGFWAGTARDRNEELRNRAAKLDEALVDARVAAAAREAALREKWNAAEATIASLEVQIDSLDVQIESLEVQIESLTRAAAALGPIWVQIEDIAFGDGSPALVRLTVRAGDWTYSIPTESTWLSPHTLREEPPIPVVGGVDPANWSFQLSKRDATGAATTFSSRGVSISVSERGVGEAQLRSETGATDYDGSDFATVAFRILDWDEAGPLPVR